MKLIYVLPVSLAIALAAGSVGRFVLARNLESDRSADTTQLVAQNQKQNQGARDGSSTPALRLRSGRTSRLRASLDKDKRPSEPSSGLYAISEQGQEQVFPLEHTEVAAKIAGNLSRVEVTQTFKNPFENPLEAVYVFPLPDTAAVDEMEIKIGDRIIKGDIKKREEAREIYEQARQQGRTAGLLEQERANIFTQSLANIKPGEKIDVTIRYTETLKFEGGDYEFVFPMVVGPRYIPGTPTGTTGTNRVPDASRINPPVLRPGSRSGHDIGVTVEIDAGLPVDDLHSTSHQIKSSKKGGIVRVELDKKDTIPNKDLVLRYRVSCKKTMTKVLSQADRRGGHFAVYLIPALKYKPDRIVPKDVVFLMDTSGSQSGDPLAKSKELMRRFINGLNPNDTFTIIDFANTAQMLSPTSLANTPENRRRAMSYIDGLDADGGTELLNGIQTVLNFTAAEEGRLRSIVLLTDGYIGNEAEVIAEVQRRLQPGNRLYSFGVGSSTNRFLLNRLAEVGRGTVQVVRQDEPTAEVTQQFFEQINNPVLANIQVTWEGAGSQPEIYPNSPPDLFAEQPLVLFGRKGDRARGKLRVTGITAGGKRYEKKFDIDFENGGNPAIPQLWGRHRIKDLMNQMYGGETVSGVKAVTDTALAYSLLSQYTAFVAVSEEVRVNPDGRTERVEVPVELPEGVSYEGIFGDSGEDDEFATGSAQPGQAQPRAVARPRRSLQSESAIDQSVLSPRPAPPVNAPRPAREPEPEMEKTEEEEILNRIEVLSATGLDSSAIANLSNYLQSVDLPEGLSGEIVFEISIQSDRSIRILFDDTASTLDDPAAIDPIKEAISSWSFPRSASGTIRLSLRVSSS
ncbi:MAG: after-VIT domain-containing protein [Oscillatoria sp. SIO1A7]|nr:after-VIT domain-containing protein [Oscillatoria sp. SIO1A7]